MFSFITAATASRRRRRCCLFVEKRNDDEQADVERTNTFHHCHSAKLQSIACCDVGSNYHPAAARIDHILRLKSKAASRSQNNYDDDDALKTSKRRNMAHRCGPEALPSLIDSNALARRRAVRVVERRRSFCVLSSRRLYVRKTGR